MEEKPIIVTTENFNQYFLEIKDLFDPLDKKMEIRLSTIDSIRITGGCRKYIVEKNERPVFFIETYTQKGGDSYFQIFCIKQNLNKTWDESLEKDPDFFSYSRLRYYANPFSNDVDDIYLQANSDKYLRFEIKRKNLNNRTLHKIKVLFLFFRRNVTEVGDKDKDKFKYLWNTFISNFCKRKT